MTALPTAPPTLTKAKLVNVLLDQMGLSKQESKEIVDVFFEKIARNLIDGEEVKLPGFGNFQIRTKAPRPGRNPRTGESVPIAQRRVVTFHISSKLKDKMESAR